MISDNIFNLKFERICIMINNAIPGECHYGEIEFLVQIAIDILQNFGSAKRHEMLNMIDDDEIVCKIICGIHP